MSDLSPGDPLAPGPGSGLPATRAGGYTSAPPPGALGPPPAEDTTPVGSRYVLAGWWSRVGAALIDGLIVVTGAILVLVLFGSVFSIGFFGGDESGIAAVVVGLIIGSVAVAVVALLYAPLMMARTNGKTLGRMAVGNRVVRANGEPMTFGYAMLREVAIKALLFGILSSLTAGLASLLDVLWPLWDEENRALHDFVVNTRTVKD